MLSHLTEKIRLRSREPSPARLRSFYLESRALVERALLEELEEDLRRVLSGPSRPDDPWGW
ncbi:MAG: hypothetical protein GYA21_19105 [Myxococcales bacterium]|nr:hypothetical protein [Myxococcales bacterium]